MSRLFKGGAHLRVLAHDQTVSADAKRYLVSGLVSAAAVILAVIHVLLPRLALDTITLVLVAVAALPWLGPVFESVELPGGWGFKYRQLKRQQQEVSRRLDQVQERVRKVEQFVQFSPAVSPDLAERLNSELKPFHQYLQALGLAPRGTKLPRVGLEPAIPGSSYDPEKNRIEISPELATNPHIMFREYCNYALLGKQAPADLQIACYDLQSGLGFYLPCSFTGEVDAFQPFGIDLGVRGALDARQGMPSPANQGRAYVWASIFWELRQLLSQAAADGALASAWLATVRAGGDGADLQDYETAYRSLEMQFALTLLDSVEQGDAASVTAVRACLVRRRALAEAVAS
jgi:hypothetical protein